MRSPKPAEQVEGARLVSVAVPVPALDLLTYRVGDALATPARGARVVVPLGPRTLTGVVVGDAPEPAAGVDLREVIAVLDEAAFLPADVLRLTSWVSEYYLAGPGATMAAAMPPHALTSRADGFRTVRVVTLTAEGHDLADRIAVGPRCSPDEPGIVLGTRQKDALLALKASPGGLDAAALAAQGISPAVVSRLRNLGVVVVRRDRVERDPFTSSGATLDTEGSPEDRALTSGSERGQGMMLRGFNPTAQPRDAYTM